MWSRSMDGLINGLTGFPWFFLFGGMFRSVKDNSNWKENLSGTVWGKWVVKGKSRQSADNSDLVQQCFENGLLAKPWSYGE